MHKKYILSLSIFVAMFVSCSHTSKKPGREYVNDMVPSIAYDAYSSNPVFKNGETNQLPVSGTISRGHLPYEYGAKSAEEQIRAGKELVNPVVIDSASLAKGKEQFSIYCAICHGDGGKGDGTLHSSGKFVAVPSDLTSDKVQNYPDGEIFHIITRGSVSGLMGSHAGQIKPSNRWMIVNYIKNKFSEKPIK